METSYENAQEKSRQDVQASTLRRFDQLNRVVLETASDGLKFLNLIELSGMAGILGFIGATKFSSAYLSSAFACFFLGVIFVACTYLFRYMHFGVTLDAYLQDVHNMNAGVHDMTWGKVCARDRQRTNGGFDFGLMCAILSLALFVAGGILGYLGVDAYAKTLNATSRQPVFNDSAPAKSAPHGSQSATR